MNCQRVEVGIAFTSKLNSKTGPPLTIYCKIDDLFLSQSLVLYLLLCPRLWDVAELSCIFSRVLASKIYVISHNGFSWAQMRT